MSPVYVDSSALVKLIVREPETDALRQYLTSAGPLTSSILATVEVSRAVARAAPESTADLPAAVRREYDSGRLMRGHPDPCWPSTLGSPLAQPR